MISKYFSLIKFSHTVFALPFAVIGFFLAVWHEGHPFKWETFLLMLGCMLSARSAAMAFNRLVDAKYDSQNARTAQREIPQGKISKSQTVFFVALSCAAFVTCTFFINKLCFILSPVALMVVLGYSYSKRFTQLSHFILGLGLSLAPVGAYLSVTGSFSWLPTLFGAAVLCWVSGFDIIYSLQDEEFDKQQKLHSIPVAIGKRRALLLSIFVHALTISCLVLIGMLGDFGAWYWTGTLIFFCLLVYQHLIVKPNDLSRVNMAFFTLNGIASIIFSVFVLIDFF